MQSITSFNAGTELGVKVGVMYSLISLLLLTGMVHIETLLQERVRLERAELRLRAELEQEVKKKTAYLMRAVEGLQSEMDERKRMEAEVDRTQTKFPAAPRELEQSALTASVLDHLDKMLDSVNLSTRLVADQVKQSKIASVVGIGILMHEHAADLGDFLQRDPRGRELPTQIAQLAEHLATEQIVLARELDLLRTSINDILAMHRKYAELAGMADMEPVAALTEETMNMKSGAPAQSDPENVSKHELMDFESTVIF
jgi:hypothetical protein